MAGRKKNDLGPRKKPLATKLSETLLDRLRRTVRGLPRTWTINRILEEGAVRMLDDLERKYNGGKPFPPLPEEEEG